MVRFSPEVWCIADVSSRLNQEYIEEKQTSEREVCFEHRSKQN